MERSFKTKGARLMMMIMLFILTNDEALGAKDEGKNANDENNQSTSGIRNGTIDSTIGRNILSRCFPSIFSFGDSQTDTGNAVSAYPSRFSSPQTYPYGMSYFASSPDRYCDGRLFVDFTAQAAGLSLLSPYLKGVGSNFASGANFAVVGATALNTSFVTPFHLGVQVDWFRRFRSIINEALSSGIPLQGVHGNTYFEEGLYIIAAGGNDFLSGLISTPNMTQALDNIQNLLPAIVNRTVEVVLDLYAEGARRFFIQNIPPTGCNPATLTMFAEADTEYDMLGCMRPVNNLARTYGNLLLDAINTLRRLHPNAIFIYADYYGVIYNIFQQRSTFGFNQTTLNCCGVGGYYNFNVLVRCGQSGILNGQHVEARPCNTPSSYMYWDGIHFTEAANRVIAQQFLHGQFLDPANAWDSLCQFDMSIFN